MLPDKIMLIQTFSETIVSLGQNKKKKIMFQKSFNSLNAANLVNREILETVHLFVLKNWHFKSILSLLLYVLPIWNLLLFYSAKKNANTDFYIQKKSHISLNVSVSGVHRSIILTLGYRGSDQPDRAQPGGDWWPRPSAGCKAARLDAV